MSICETCNVPKQCNASLTRHDLSSRQPGERGRDNHKEVALLENALVLRVAVREIHVTPPSIEGMRAAWLSGR